ncbi:hypothetical protein Zmor_024187 [Zophobas morio]|uniref:lysozyme n=1 Tax=Zophobas morio TaxID=2755281 RepID=A0AA38HZR0_9CUCU|nr:hypothetical protein Zmor_024187 [Zophobas morio]
MVRLDSVLLTVLIVCSSGKQLRAPIVRFKALPPTSLYSQPLQFVPWIVSDQCLSCLCYTMSLCDISNNNCGDDDDGCGRFKITKDYWVDSGKHTIRNWLPQSDDSYVSCVSDFDCTIQSVQSYMVKFQQDCNGDGKIDCDDFVALHLFGPAGCRSNALTGVYRERYQSCIKQDLKLIET